MAEKIAFQIQPEGYAPLEVDAFVDLLLENYEELLAHYQSQQAELEEISAQLAKKADATPVQPVEPAPSAKDQSEEAVELLQETAKVVSETKKQTRAKITALIDQAALHAYRLDDAAKNMKEELDKMYTILEDQL